ncbi:MAG: M13 family metallopeptidase [Alloprevotella sp.]|nr:M13 family metallopeptidase [Alloprevotella sp.]
MKKILILIAMTTISLSVAAQTNSTGLNTQGMDTSVKPGTDFYEFAGGNWIKQHPLTPEFSRYGQFNVLSENNQKQIRDLITELASTPQEQGSLGQKIGSLYKLAMDSVRRNQEGYEPIKPVLRKVYDIRSRQEYQLVMAQLERRGIGAMMFGIGIGADLRNAAQNIVGIGQGGLSMGERDYYLNDDEPTAKVRDAYRQYVKQLFLLTGDTDEAAEKKMNDVLAIETRIAKASYSATQMRDVEGNYHKMTYNDLVVNYPGIDWGNILLAIGYPTVAQVDLNQPEPILEVGKILQDTPLESLKNYAAFKVIDDAANALDDQFREASFNFYSKTMNGAEEDRPRWKRAVSVVEGVLGMAVGKMYVEKYFPESSKQRMLELVGNLQQALGERIQASTWMSDDTKQKALEKLSTFYVKIGYPDKWKDYSALTIDEDLSYYENLANAAEFSIADVIARKANKPTTKDEWFMTPQTVNAYYNPTTNEICFPAGILQPPFFNPAADDAVNYGAIGVVIGHEMTHGFDDQGSQFDKDGNLSNWWTEADKKHFEERTKVMEQFFNKIEVLPGMYANGKLTLGENIADNGGLNVAYQALQNAMKKNPLSKADGYTPEQRFFISYGFVWSQNIREEQLRQFNKTDPHSPGRWRVNGALPQIDAWYKAFNITKRDPLFVPKKNRVDVW